jgi:hypothetical protein
MLLCADLTVDVIAGSSATPSPIATNFLMASIVGISTGILSSTRFFLNVSITFNRYGDDT